MHAYMAPMVANLLFTLCINLYGFKHRDLNPSNHVQPPLLGGFSGTLKEFSSADAGQRNSQFKGQWYGM